MNPDGSSVRVVPQVNEFKYFGVWFTIEGKMKIKRQIGDASAVMWTLSLKAKLLIYWISFVESGSFTLKGLSSSGFGMWCILNASQWNYSGHVQLGGDHACKPRTR